MNRYRFFVWSGLARSICTEWHSSLHGAALLLLSLCRCRGHLYPASPSITRRHCICFYRVDQWLGTVSLGVQICCLSLW